MPPLKDKEAIKAEPFQMVIPARGMQLFPIVVAYSGCASCFQMVIPARGMQRFPLVAFFTSSWGSFQMVIPARGMQRKVSGVMPAFVVKTFKWLSPQGECNDHRQHQQLNDRDFQMVIPARGMQRKPPHFCKYLKDFQMVIPARGMQLIGGKLLVSIFSDTFKWLSPQGECNLHMQHFFASPISLSNGYPRKGNATEGYGKVV